MGVLSGITHKYRHISSDDFGGHLVLRIEDQERNIRTEDRHVIGLEIAKIVYYLFQRMESGTYKIVKSFLISLSLNRDYLPLGILLRVLMTIVWYHGDFTDRIFY